PSVPHFTIIWSPVRPRPRTGPYVIVWALASTAGAKTPRAHAEISRAPRIGVLLAMTCPGRSMIRTMRAMVALLMLTGCGSLSFDVDQDLPEQRIQGSPLGALLPSFLAPFPLSIDVRSETQKRSTGPAT